MTNGVWEPQKRSHVERRVAEIQHYGAQAVVHLMGGPLEQSASHSTDDAVITPELAEMLIARGAQRALEQAGATRAARANDEKRVPAVTPVRATPPDDDDDDNDDGDDDEDDEADEEERDASARASRVLDRVASILEARAAASPRVPTPYRPAELLAGEATGAELAARYAGLMADVEPAEPDVLRGARIVMAEDTDPPERHKKPAKDEDRKRRGVPAPGTEEDDEEDEEEEDDGEEAAALRRQRIDATRFLRSMRGETAPPRFRSNVNVEANPRAIAFDATGKRTRVPR